MNREAGETAFNTECTETRRTQRKGIRLLRALCVSVSSVLKESFAPYRRIARADFSIPEAA